MKLKDAEDHHLEDADLKVAAQPQVGLCTLCFCFSTEMLHLNAPFFPLKCSAFVASTTGCFSETFRSMYVRLWMYKSQ